MSSKWSICLPSFDNYVEVYFTVEALRMYHDLTNKEIVICDNYGDSTLREFCSKTKDINIRYIIDTRITGVSHAKNAAIAAARYENILCMDSHILVGKNTFDKEPTDGDIIHGAMLDESLQKYTLGMLPVWRSNMWGIWAEPANNLPLDPIDIWAHGAGFFIVKKKSWLGFNKNFKGWGGETGYIQEKYRKAGGRVLCYPNVTWKHLFYNKSAKRSYAIDMSDRIRNYLIGFNELGLDKTELYKMFGDNAKKVEATL